MSQYQKNLIKAVFLEAAERGWTDSELAEQLGTIPQYVYKWKTGASGIGPKYLKRVMEVFGKTEQELINRTGKGDNMDANKLIEVLERQIERLESDCDHWRSLALDGYKRIECILLGIDDTLKKCWAGESEHVAEKRKAENH